MSLRRHLGGAVIALALACPAAPAQTPFTYTFSFTGSPNGSGVVGVGNPPSPTGVVVGNFIRSGGAVAAAGADLFNSSGFSTTSGITGTLSTTLAPSAAGNIVDLSATSFQQSRNSSGPTDGRFAADVFNVALVDSGTIPLALTSRSVTSFRVISQGNVELFWRPTNAAATSGTYQVDNVTLSGSVASASAPLALSGSVVVAARTASTTLSGALSGTPFDVATAATSPHAVTLTANSALSTPQFQATGTGATFLNNPGPGAAITVTGIATVNTSSTLGGTGRIVTPNLQVGPSATLYPGNGTSIGNFTVTGAVELTPGSRLRILAGGSSSSQLIASGAMNVGASGTPRQITIDNDGTMVFGSTYTYTVATMASTTGFAPSQFTVVAGNFPGFIGTPIVTNPGGTSLVVQFTPVPEPTTVLGICAAAAGGVGWLRRRRATTA